MVARHGEENVLHQDQKFANPFGVAGTYSTTGSVRLDGAFFTSFGTNGRTCGSCHQPSDGWTVIPEHVQARFDATGGTDPIFRTNDGSVSPDSDVSTVAKRRIAYAMLTSKGLIRVGIGIPFGAEFTLLHVDDPYHHANSSDLSLFRRPLPSANLNMLSTVMWDGRETFRDTTSPPAADSNCLNAPFPAGTCFKSVDFDLLDQSNGATRGHAASARDLTAAERREIVDFESSLFFAQMRDNDAGRLDHRGATGGPNEVAEETPYFGKNDNFGDYRTHADFTSRIFTLYDAWANDGDDDDHDNEGWNRNDRRAKRESIARGQDLFNNFPITITGVGGLSGTLIPDPFVGTCGTCHDMPNGGDHTIPAPLNIGIADGARRTPDMPLYTLRNNVTGATIDTTDPGRALITGKWADIGKFKGPILRGVAARAPYFHNGSAANLDEVIDFYVDRFNMNLSAQQHDDLVNFLAAL